MSNQNSGIDMDDLLDATLDDLADLPEFKPFAVGAHRATIKWALKDINELKGCPELTITHVETVELTNPEDTPPKPGDTCSIAYMLKKKDKATNQFVPNEIAQGQFKEVCKVLAAHFGTSSIRETMDASNGAEVLVVMGIRTDKRDANNLKYYADLKSIQVM